MKLLIIDDAQDVRLILSAWAKRKGYDFAIAQDGEQGWEMMMEEHFHIVISDWLMPRLSGLDLCKRIRNHSFPHYVYIVLLTGLSEVKDMIVGLEAGADDYCYKPINIEELNVRMGTAARVIELESSLANKNADLQRTYDELADVHCRLDKDLENAACLQQALLPQRSAEDAVPFDYAWYYRPAIQVGGDTLDVALLSEQLTVFYLIDISGHGVSAAMLSISLNTLLKVIVQKHKYRGAEEIPQAVVNEINSRLVDLGLSHYCTMLYGVIDRKEKNIFYVQAGHPGPIYRLGSSGVVNELAGSGYPVGLLDDVDFETQKIEYESGDELLIYSDGLSDLLVAEHEGKTMAEICEPCLSGAKSASAAMKSLESKLLTTSVLQQQEDDVSMLLLCL